MLDFGYKMISTRWNDVPNKIWFNKDLLNVKNVQDIVFSIKSCLYWTLNKPVTHYETRILFMSNEYQM